MNLSFLIAKQHIFKQRRFTRYNTMRTLRWGSVGLLSARTQRFELVYLRSFKKLIRRRYVKVRVRFLQAKFWFLLKPNLLLTMKPKNSRMGAGVGLFVRLARQLTFNKTFIEFQNFPIFWVIRMFSFLRYRYPIKFLVINK